MSGQQAITAASPPTCAPITPEAGPDSRVCTWYRRHCLVMTPPFDLVDSTRATGTCGRHFPLQVPEVGLHLAADKGIDDGRQRPFIFTLLGPDLRRSADEELRAGRLDRVMRRDLMDRVTVGMKKTDGQCLDAELLGSHRGDRIRDSKWAIDIAVASMRSSISCTWRRMTSARGRSALK